MAGGSVRRVRSRTRRVVVVLGMLSRIPVAGVVWQNLHYVLGLNRLGFETHYVEAHARTPSMLMDDRSLDGSAEAAAFLDRVFRAYDLGDRWAFHALHSDGRVYGKSERELHALYRDAALIINLHGGTVALPEHSATGRLVYLETDPVHLQIEIAQGDQEAIDYLEPHCAFFTFGENYGRAGCGLPVSERFPFKPTRQPVVMDLWRHGRPLGDVFTTVASWRQHWRPVTYGGATYSWSKEQQFRRFLDVPRRTGQRFELALAAYEPGDASHLAEHGWAVRDGFTLSLDPAGYQAFIQSSRGEFTSAKEQNVVFRTGWFSDRSATYLASGRPVVTQDTGFGDLLPTGEGLFAFSTEDDAVAAIEEIERDPHGHSRAALDIAHEHFDADRVLGALLDEVGVEIPRRTIPSWSEGLPDDLVLEPVSRRPLRLPEATETVAATLPLPPPPVDQAEPVRATVIIVTYGHATVTRLCLATVLATTTPADEVLVVDNASPDDGSAALLDELERRGGRLRVLRNDRNLGFAAAVNQGAAAARGSVLVVLNNDVLVAPGWLDRLVAACADRAVGALSPTTNRIDGEEQVPSAYRTWGGFRRQARRALDTAVVEPAASTLRFFCTAMRAEVFGEVGPLDEGYGVGLFEDDDYCRRLVERGYRLGIRNDVFVHHFGEASLGDLVASGAHSALFAKNRDRFEQRWGEWRQPERHDPVYDEAVDRIRASVLAATPDGAGVAVVSLGDPRLLDLAGRRAWHLPSDADGTYAGHHPADSEEALAHVARLRDSGAEYVVVPAWASWWWDHYAEFAANLRRRPPVVDDVDCTVVALAQEPT